MMNRVHRVVALVLAFIASPAVAADYPAPKQGEWVAKDFKFHTGEVMPELRLAYTTIGDPSGKDAARQRLDEGVVREHMRTYLE